MSKKELRSAVLGETPNTEVYELSDGSAQYKLKALTRGQMKEIERKCEGDDYDRTDYMILECVHDPETGEKVFGDADLDAINDAPADGKLQELVFAVLHVNGQIVTDEDTEEDKKKSQTSSDEKQKDTSESTDND